MAQVKMQYGIDLGTTNSSLCKMEGGIPVIRKTDTLKDTLPSCVYVTEKGVIRVGDTAYNALRADKAQATKNWLGNEENVFLEFKRTMGLDTQYSSSHIRKGFSSEELSAEVLKALKSLVTEDNVTSAVITIPAKFKADQIAATKRAATMAGIEHCELLQEPIAASIAYGLSVENRNGKWLVFDFGGGTFDAALVSVENGVMQVKDTEGDNYLGGKNLDYAIVDQIIIPRLQEKFALDGILADDNKKKILRDAMKFYAEEAKNSLSFKYSADLQSQLDEFGTDDNGTEIELDMSITYDDIEPILRPYFQKTVDIVNQLLARNQLTGDNLDALVLVGGPTYSPILRGMLQKQVTLNVDTSINPMTAVARGAALYAAGIDCESESDTTGTLVALDLTYESTSVDTVEYVAITVVDDECRGAIPNVLYTELSRRDGGWTSGKTAVPDSVGCLLNQGTSNTFDIRVYDEQGNSYPCFPEEITIIQGIVVGNAVLPYHIGIEVRDDQRGSDVFVPLRGLEKNQTLPAIGVKNDLFVAHDLHPGNASDTLCIPIYQGEHQAEGTSAIYNDHVFDVVITGSDVLQFVPAHSKVDIILKVDSSQLMTCEAHFTETGETIEKTVEVSQREGVSDEDLDVRFSEAHQKLSALQDNPSVDSAELANIVNNLMDIRQRFEYERMSEDGKMHLLADLRRLFLALETVENAHPVAPQSASLKNK